MLRACLGVSMTAALVAACGGSSGTAAPGGTAQATAAPGGAASGAPALSGGAAALARLFPIGVYVQAPDNFGLWKSRGVNTMVVVPDGNSETA